MCFKGYTGTGACKASAIFQGLAARIAKEPGIASEVGAVLGFKLTDPAAEWTVDLTGAGAVKEGATWQLEDEPANVRVERRDSKPRGGAPGSTVAQVFRLSIRFGGSAAWSGRVVA